MTTVTAQDGRFTVQEMADRFGTSRRTMLRDLQTLSAMGLPLAASPGPGGGYLLVYARRQVNLSLLADEALALILSYESALQDVPSPFKNSSVCAITKLRAVLSPEVVRELDRLRERIAMVSVKRVYEAPYLSDLLRASLDQVHLRIKYDSRRAASERLIFPYGLISGLGFWYCACYDYKREANAWLRVDRITELERAEELAPRETMPMSEWMQLSPDAQQQMVKVNASVTAKGMKELDWSDFADAFTHNRNGSATIKKMVPASSIDFYARIFLPLGCEVVVKSPPELVAAICAKAQSVLSLYGK